MESYGGLLPTESCYCYYSPTNIHWDTVLDIGNTIFSILLSPKVQDQCPFPQQGLQYTFTALPKGYLSSAVFCLQGMAQITVISLSYEV